MLIQNIFNFLLHLDESLLFLFQEYGLFIYAIIFFTLFAETGFVLTPFLPGDSLLFVVGALASKGMLNLFLLFVIIFSNVFCGDNVNYWIGRYLGPRVFREKSRLFKREYLLKTQDFYEKHGGKAIIIARFIPIIRTFAPFVAGIGSMYYLKFLAFSIIGTLLWVIVFLMGGYFFSAIPFISNHLEFLILAIIIISFTPILIGLLKNKLKRYPRYP